MLPRNCCQGICSVYYGLLIPSECKDMCNLIGYWRHHHGLDLTFIKPKAQAGIDRRLRVAMAPFKHITQGEQPMCMYQLQNLIEWIPLAIAWHI